MQRYKNSRKLKNIQWTSRFSQISCDEHELFWTRRTKQPWKRRKGKQNYLPFTERISYYPPPPQSCFSFVKDHSALFRSVLHFFFFFKVEDSLSLLILRLLFPYLHRMCSFFVYTKLSRTLFCYFFDTIASHSTLNYTEKRFYQILGKVMYQSVRFHGHFTSSRNLIFQFWISISVEQLLRR